MQVDSLSTLGPAYQSKIIVSLVLDKDFLEASDDILYPEYFESEANQWIVTKIKEYYQIYKTPPTAEVFKVELDKETNDLFKDEIVKKLKDASDFSDAPDLTFVKEKFLEFCVNQHYKISIYKSIDLLKNKEYDKIKKLFDDASKVGQNKNIGLKLLSEDVNNIFLKMKRNCIPTPWDIINDISEGGSGGGELWINVSGPGGGKTWTLCDVGAFALRTGLSVIHYTLELSETMVAKRYYSAITGIASHDLPYNIAEIMHKIKSLSAKASNLTIKEYPTKGASVNTLRAHIDKMIKLGLPPNLIIVDYGDLLKAPQYYKEKRLELGNIFEELRGLAGEFKVPVWTASQANRSGAETDTISGEQVSEDYSKIFIGDFIFSTSRKVEDQVHKTARIFIIKNRFGVDKITFPAKFDVSNGNLNIYEEKSVQGQELKGNMNKKENNVRKLLKDRFYSDKKKTE